MEELLKIAKNNNGFIYTKDVVKHNIRKEILSDLVSKGELIRLKTGVY